MNVGLSSGTAHPAKLTTSSWHAGHLAGLHTRPENTIAVITATDVVPVLPGYDLWDLWPVQLENGACASIAGGTLWMILSAPLAPDPADRHAFARIRLMLERDGRWHDLGNFLPERLCPGQREWAGSAVYDPAVQRITLYYTAAGRRGDAEVRFEQRLFMVTATLHAEGAKIWCSDWSAPCENIVADGQYYVRVDGTVGAPGFIKGFRDPAFFRDPAGEADYLVFTASRAGSSHCYNGVIGMATRQRSAGATWQILPPLIDADGLSNELERPHIIAKNGLYYVFWSTQRHMFAPDGPSGPTGLYGMVAADLHGPYRPLNGSGLIAGTPESEPRQSYSWWVCEDLSVVSFIDHWGLAGRNLTHHPQLNRAQFGGTPAPVFSLMLDGDCAKIVTV